MSLNFGRSASLRTLVFHCIFGITLLLCGWGAVSHFGTALRGSHGNQVGRRLRVIGSAISGLLMMAYVLGYTLLSLQGAYGPATAGVHGVKTYAWYPRGFHEESGKWRDRTMAVFIPIWFLDIRYWHDDWLEGGAVTGASRDRPRAQRERTTAVRGASAAASHEWHWSPWEFSAHVPAAACCGWSATQPRSGASPHPSAPQQPFALRRTPVRRYAQPRSRLENLRYKQFGTPTLSS